MDIDAAVDDAPRPLDDACVIRDHDTWQAWHNEEQAMSHPHFPTMWIESHVGSGEFGAIRLPQGSLCAFFGTMLRHFAPPNVTPWCRVSLDFRVAFADEWNPEWVLPGLAFRHQMRRIAVGRT